MGTVQHDTNTTFKNLTVLETAEIPQVLGDVGNGGLVVGDGAFDKFALTVNGNMRLGFDAGDYRYIQFPGGNSTGYLFGQFPALGDGIHYTYNLYYDNGGVRVIPNAGGRSSRLQLSYGSFGFYTSPAANTPETITSFLDYDGLYTMYKRGLYFPNTVAASPRELSYYDTGSFNSTQTGPWAAHVSVIRYTRIGNIVSLYIPAYAAVATAAAVLTGDGLPAALRPSLATVQFLHITDNTVVQVGMIQLSNSANYVITNEGGAAFTIAQSAGVFNACTITYMI
jgi:hypothetical protein